VYLRAVCFDVGNTLLGLDYALVARVLREAGGVNVDLAQLRRDDAAVRFEIDRELADDVRSGIALGRATVSLTSPTVWRRYFAALLDRAGVERDRHRDVIGRLQAHERDDALGLWSKPEPHAAAALAALRKRGLRLGVVSNSDGRIAARLALVGLDHLFDEIVDSAVVGVEKPDPRIFHLACARLSVAPRDAAYVGDLLSIDVLAARRAGLHAWLYDPCRSYGGVETARFARYRQLSSRLARAREAAGAAVRVAASAR
jgi:putative hydrolase of the HAD superfamily